MANRTLKISQSVTDNAAPESKRYIINDSDISGFRLVVQPSGRKTFFLRYRIGGGRSATIREPKIGDAGSMKTEKARSIALDWVASIRQGGDPGGERHLKRTAPRMSDLFERYLSDHALPNKKPSSAEDDARIIRTLVGPFFGRLKVEEVTRADIDKFHKGLSDRPYRANRCIALLSKAFSLAEVWGWRQDNSNPTRHVAKFREEKRKRFLSFKEFGKLGASLQRAENGELSKPVSPYAVGAIRLLCFTGARRGEVLGLQWDWIDWDAACANLPDSKTGDKRLPLNAPSLDVLKSLPRLPDNPHVIAGGKPGAALVNLKTPWALIRADAGLDDLRLHDLRHSFASIAVAGGMSLPLIGAMLGHSQPQTTARYAHLADDPVRSASDAVANKVAAAMAGLGAKVNKFHEEG